MQDFYHQFKVFFDLSQISFIEFLCIYINEKNYCSKYGSYDLIQKYFSVNKRKIKNIKEFQRKKNEIEKKIPKKSLFNWNNDSIINSLKITFRAFSKKKINEFNIKDMFEFLKKDLIDEIGFYKELSELEDNQNKGILESANNYGLKNPEQEEDVSLQNTLRKLKVNENLLEDFRSEFQLNKQTNSKKIIDKKFVWMDTEENLIKLIEYMFSAGLLNMKCYKERNAIIQSTFLNKNNESFNNKQLSVTFSKMDKNKKIDSLDFEKFVNSLVKNLNSY